MHVLIRSLLLLFVLSFIMLWAQTKPLHKKRPPLRQEKVEHALIVTGENQNATLQGRWAKGPTFAVSAKENGQVYFGDGAELVCGTINSSGKITEKGRVVLPAELKDIEISSSGNYAYVAVSYQGLAVVDISSPDNPQLVYVLTDEDNPFDAKAVAKSGNHLYIAAGYGGLKEATIFAADSIVFGDTYVYNNCNIEDVAANNDTVYAASGGVGVEMLRYHNSAFNLIEQINYNQYTTNYQSQTPMPRSLYLQNDSLFIADSWVGLFFFIKEDNALTFSGVGLGACTNVAVRGNYVYTTDYQNVNVLSISDGTPTYLDSREVSTSMQMAISGNFAIVAAKSHGVYTFDISDPSTFNGGDFYGTSSLTYDVFRQGNYLYRITPINTLDVISVSNPGEPHTVGHLDLGSETEEANKIYVSGDMAFISSWNYMDGSALLYFVDISSKSNPQKLASWIYPTTGSLFSDIVLKEKILYAALGQDIVAVDFSDLSNIREIGKVTSSGWINELAVAGNYIYTASEDAGMSVIDISDPAHPQEKITFRESDMDYYVGIQIQDSYAFIADSYIGLKIIDISNPLAPVLAGSFTQADGDFNADQLAVAGNYAYIQRGWGEVIFLNINDPSHPQLKGVYYASSVNGITAYSRNVNIVKGYSGIDMVSNDNNDALRPCHVAGEISGEWTCPTIYVESDLTILEGDTLRITESVEKVVFLGPYQITVEGVLLASGPENETTTLGSNCILFSGREWRGIVFSSLNDKSVGTSVIENCRFDYANRLDAPNPNGGAMLIYNSDNVVVKHCVFYRNNGRLGGAVYLENSDAHIEDCHFEINGRGGVNTAEIYATAGGALFVENSQPYLHRLKFMNNAAKNGGGALVLSNSSVNISNIMLVRNEAEGLGGAMEIVSNITGANIKITNMTAADNTADPYGGALHIAGENSHVEIINSILYDNGKPEIYNESGTPAPTVTYSIVDSAATESWFGSGCSDTNPYLTDDVDYHLSNNSCAYSNGNTAVSPAIDTGHPDSLDTELDCYAGLGTSRADMGFYGGRYADISTGMESNSTQKIPQEFSLWQNYPNPFNPSTSIRYQVVKQGQVQLTVYNLLGQIVATLVNQKQISGQYTVTFNASGLASGVYLYRLKTPGFEQTKKMLLIR